ncbi:MaoC/PaaZ C-terminal domain-containing protein [Gulosibacter molinativorax]|uniref:Acyl dehydratase n=1 Tax=Gulosibacter molinativorax TaxID=256821 RepID=A0ABT7CAK4_9MICO|nr:MaoC/PaaZ C-terminal domain-containing protein [Gulosibacter molinativorax]MDJ1372233.1 acyl dehydratase [Gulosibacter molinativorax]QUY63485.1 Beta-hydroxyacyl-[acyl-carrier-protein] dehydratase subunit HadB [Gulosibacter molinativorax]
MTEAKFSAAAGTDLSQHAVGDVITEQNLHLTRDALVRYAGASGDFNPIHYRDDIAAEVGLPGVLAHGMLTMGAAIAPLVELLGDPGRVVEYQVKFTRPVVVDPVEGADVSVVAKIGEAADELGVGRVDLDVIYDGKAVLGKAQVRARFTV